MEFPLYQLLVARVVEATGWPLDLTGRAISLLFYYLTLIPIYFILRPYGPNAVGLAFAVFLSSPIEIFFARTFLIETLATFLSVGALAYYVSYLRNHRISAILMFAIVGSFAGLQKVTTFLPVILVCALDTGVSVLRKRSEWYAFAKASLPVVLLMGLSMILPVLWIWHSDKVKETGLLSSFITSAALREWNFGTLAVRMEVEYWLKVFGYRLVLLGGFTVAAMWIFRNALRGCLTVTRESLLAILIGLCGPLAFARLFYVHDYYFVASIAFLACGTAIAISCNGKNGMTTAKAGAMIVLVAVANLSIFSLKYLEKLHQFPDVDNLSYKIARYLNDKVAPNDVIVIVGLDWNSTIPYYSERYALMVPTWIPAHKAVILNPVKFIGGRRVGAIVQCADYDWNLNSLEGVNLFKTIEGRVEKFGMCGVKVASK